MIGRRPLHFARPTRARGRRDRSTERAFLSNPFDASNAGFDPSRRHDRRRRPGARLGDLLRKFRFRPRVAHQPAAPRGGGRRGARGARGQPRGRHHRTQRPRQESREPDHREGTGAGGQDRLRRPDGLPRQARARPIGANDRRRAKAVRARLKSVRRGGRVIQRHRRGRAERRGRRRRGRSRRDRRGQGGAAPAGLVPRRDPAQARGTRRGAGARVPDAPRRPPQHPRGHDRRRRGRRGRQETEPARGSVEGGGCRRGVPPRAGGSKGPGVRRRVAAVPVVAGVELPRDAVQGGADRAEDAPLPEQGGADLAGGQRRR